MKTFRILALSLLVSASFAHADATLDRIHSRGEVSIGIIVDSPPYGFTDPRTGQPAGFNIDLAHDIARQLNTKVTFVPVTPPNRVAFLQQGKVDLLIANMQLNADRAAILDPVPTPYGDAGGGLITRKGGAIKRWEDVKGKVVCVSQGSNYAKPLAETYGANVRGLPGMADSLLALKSGACVASVHDSAALVHLVETNPEWKDYNLPIANDLIPLPSVIWVRKGETDTAHALDRIVRSWYHNGWLLKLTRQYHIPVSAEFEAWQARFGSGK